MQLDATTGLVLEGGGMRGVFTTGVLDYLLDHKIYFPYSIGVSAGACNGLSYISRQRGRARASNIDLLEKYRYIGFRYFFTQHSIFDQKFMYDTLPNKELPFAYDTYFASKAQFEIVTTNCRTGKACYMDDRSNPERLIQIVKASSSLPFVCPIVDVDGEPMLDGGIVDSIPIERSIEMGHPVNVVVLTRNRGFRKQENDRKVPKYIYKEYPRLRLLLSKRNKRYNQQLQLVEQLETEGRVLLICPERPIEVGRLESNTQKLEALYQEGYECARKAFEKVTLNL